MENKQEGGDYTIRENIEQMFNKYDHYDHYHYHTVSNKAWETSQQILVRDGKGDSPAIDDWPFIELW
jgi:hypothetical protein